MAFVSHLENNCLASTISGSAMLRMVNILEETSLHSCMHPGAS
jgi:hypothetical protein